MTDVMWQKKLFVQMVICFFIIKSKIGGIFIDSILSLHLSVSLNIRLSTCSAPWPLCVTTTLSPPWKSCARYDCVASVLTKCTSWYFLFLLICLFSYFVVASQSQWGRCRRHFHGGGEFSSWTLHISHRYSPQPPLQLFTYTVQANFYLPLTCSYIRKKCFIYLPQDALQ